MNGGGKGAAAIPAGSRKIVQSLKEIVNCSDAEIYAMLKECNMDPSEAVHRLLAQDTFHEVKSKREKRKETKDIPESRSRSLNNYTSRGVRGGTERGGYTSSNHRSSNDYGVTHTKPVHKKENGISTGPTILVSGSGTAGSNQNQRSTALRESVQNMTQATALADCPPLPSQPSSGFQPKWSQTPGQPSMADIVRMGRPQEKASSTPTMTGDTFHASHDPNMSNVSERSARQTSTRTTPSVPAHKSHISQSTLSQDEERSHELGTGSGHNSHENWSLVGETTAASSSAQREISDASISGDPSASSSLLANEANLEQDPQLDESRVQEGDDHGDCLPSESSSSAPEGQIEVDNSAGSTHPDNGLLNGMSYHSQIHEVDDANEEIASDTSNFQQLNIQNEDFSPPSTDGAPAVIIPRHLQVANTDCSYLSFGSFDSGVNARLPMKTLQTNLEMAAVVENTPLDQLNSRNPEYHDDEQLQSTLTENVMLRTSSSRRSYDMPSASQDSQSENVRDDTLDATHGLHANLPSVSGYEFSATTEPSSTYTYPGRNSQMHDPYQQPYTDSLPRSLLAPSGQPSREYDLPLSALFTTQSMPINYNTTPSTVSGPTLMAEMKPDVLSAPQPTQQALPSSNAHNVGGPAFPQHLPIHPFSQQTLPSGHFGNMYGYPYLPQSYAFLPSAAFQQAYASNSPFHQSPAAAMKYSPLPQYKSSIPGSSLQQSPPLPHGYGGFNSLTSNVTGGLSLNPSRVSTSEPVGFEQALSSQYKEGSQYLQLQHHESPSMWMQGAGSRAASALPGSNFYGFQGQQNQQSGGFRQAQQQPQQQQQLSQYGQMGYLNMYQSQGGSAQEQHQQNANEGNLGGSQGPALHHLWQHGY